MEDEPSDDYFAAVAAVVEAARDLSSADEKLNEAFEAYGQRIEDRKAAAKRLEESLDGLSKVNARQSEKGGEK